MDTLAGTCTRAFAGVPESVSAARVWVASFLPGSPAAYDAALMTSELVTNAISYSASGLPGGVVLVSVSTGSTWIRVDVFDQGDLPASAVVERGLGLGLVLISQLADTFGADDADKWFALRTCGVR
jgi:anti-sigma regulatory factor (Ser/Thr protein kinase)